MSAEQEQRERAVAMQAETDQFHAECRMQQLLHGLRLAAADDMSPARDLEQLARLIDSGRNPRSRRRA